MEWVLFTVSAAVLQSFRTAGQKHLAGSVTALGATWVRYGFGLPFAWAYAIGIGATRPEAFVVPTAGFWQDILCASLAQIAGTVLLVRVLTLRNFAVGTTYAKSEAILTAVISSTLLGVALDWTAWVSILLGFLGVALVSVRRAGVELRDLFQDRATLYGLGAGLGFAATSLWLRHASLSLRTDFLLSAAMTLVAMVSFQTIVAGLWLVRTRRGDFARMRIAWRMCLFVGATSALGSAAWFTAMTYQEVAYVKALGQVEFIVTVLITYWGFRERITGIEWAGIAITLVAVLLLTLR